MEFQSRFKMKQQKTQTLPAFKINMSNFTNIKQNITTLVKDKLFTAPSTLQWVSKD